METICVYTGEFQHEALSVKELLESNGIPAIMPNEYATSANPNYSLFTGGYTILVNRTQFLQASELLVSLHMKVQNREIIDNLRKLQEEKVLEVCPYCGNASMETVIVKRRGFSLLIGLLSFLPVHADKKKRVCHVCGAEEVVS